MTIERHVGVVTWFDQEKGYGFIRRQSGDDVVVHSNAVSGDSDLARGQQVSFTLYHDEDTPKADDVTVI